MTIWTDRQVVIVRGLARIGWAIQHGLHGFVPSAIAESVAEFAFHSGKGLQQELTEVAESGGAARPDAVLGEGAKYLAEGVIEVGSRGEFAGGSLEFDDGLAGAGTLAGLLRFDDCLRCGEGRSAIDFLTGESSSVGDFAEDAAGGSGVRRRKRTGSGRGLLLAAKAEERSFAPVRLC